MRFIKTLFAFGLIVVLGFNTHTMQVMAANANVKTETVFFTMANGNNVKVDYYTNEIVVTTLNTGTVERIVQQDNYNVTYYDANGTNHNISWDELGNAYYDNELYYKADQSKIQGTLNSNTLSTSFSTSSTSPWGSNWHYLTTTRTSQSLYDASAGIAVTLIGFVPGLGFVAGVSSLVLAFIGMARPNAYYIVDQYYSTDMRQVRERVYVYSESNFTGYQGYTDTAPHSIF